MMHINLRMVERMERADGGISGLAQRLLEKKATPEEAAALGMDLPALAAAVTEVFARLGDMGALMPGRRADMAALRRFFMGVLGWPPRVVMEEAALQDLADARAGFCAFRGIRPGVSPQFMARMVQQFPDAEVKHDDRIRPGE